MATGIINKNIVLLWENPNPSSSFQPQNIPLDLSAYNFVLIRVRNSENSSNYFDSVVTVGEQANLMRVALVTSAERFYLGTRTVNVSSSGCNFGNGMQCTFSSGTSDNNPSVNIPIAIYGIRS